MIDDDKFQTDRDLYSNISSALSDFTGNNTNHHYGFLEGKDVGVGHIINGGCDEDELWLYLKIQNDIIIDAKFECDACMDAMVTTELVIRKIIGKTIDEARVIDISDVNRVISNYHGSRPHCALLLNDLISSAIEDYEY